jgi:hypothetical protein
MWRLMATILVMSDTGSVSLVATHTDWPTEQQCRELIQTHYQSPQPKELNGHLVTAKVSASCVPINPPVMAQSEHRRPQPNPLDFFPMFVR